MLAEDRLSAVERGYKEGVYLSHQPDYQHLYSHSKDRDIKLQLVRTEGNTDITRYKAIVDGRQYEGVLLIEFDENDKAVGETEYIAPVKSVVDQTMAGQLVDVASTAFGVGVLGAVEANPIMAPLASGTGWLLMAGLKSGAALAGDSKPFAECVAWRSTLSKLGWSAAVWNIAGTLINPVVGLGAAAGTWFLSSESVDADAVARCLEVR